MMRCAPLLPKRKTGTPDPGIHALNLLTHRTSELDNPIISVLVSPGPGPFIHQRERAGAPGSGLRERGERP